MNISIKVLLKDHILDIIPLMIEYTEGNTATEVLEARFLEMTSQNYECAAMYDGDKLKFKMSARPIYGEQENKVFHLDKGIYVGNTFEVLKRLLCRASS